MPEDFARVHLTPPNAARLLATLGVRPRALFSDVDGTLSTIAPNPGDATLLPGVADLLRQAQTCFDMVALVSGRAVLDLYRMVGIPGLLYIGNHGLEWLDATTPEPRHEIVVEAVPYVHLVAQALDAIYTPLKSRFRGIRAESKGVTASIHVRGARNPENALHVVTLRATMIAVPMGLRVTTGRHVVELRPPVAMDKGTSVQHTIQEHGLRSAIYLGDDRTDIDAFTALRTLHARGICQTASIAVLSPEAPETLAGAADITLPDIEAVPPMLTWLLEALGADAAP